MALSRTLAAALLALAAVVAFGAACGGGGEAEKETVEERWARLDVAEPEIVFLGDWTDGERAAITREMKGVQVAHAERFGVVTSEFTLYVSTERELLNEPYRERFGRRAANLPAWFTCGGFAGESVLFIVLERCDEEVRARGGPIAHEYFHVLQFHVGMVGGASGMWPAALAEGAAIYASAHHAEEQGRWTVAWRREAARLEWSALGVCFPVVCNAGMETMPAYSDSLSEVLRYEVGFLVVDWLVEQRDEEALMEFFRLGGGRHEFEQAFDMTLEEFGEGVEALWREVAPPFTSRVSGSVLDPEGPVSYAEVEPLMRVGDERIVLTGVRADSGGAFDFFGPDEGHTLGVFLKCPDGSPAAWVLAGEWGEDGFVADEDGDWERGGEGAKPLEGVYDRTGIVIELPETEQALKEKHCDR